MAPVALAELGLPGPTGPRLAEDFDSGCRDDLLNVDGMPMPVRVSGAMADAVAGEALSVTVCRTGDLPLSGGQHRIESTRGADTGIDLDQLVPSASGGGPSPTTGTLVAEVPLPR